ncbi:hypothetical protein BCR33DRAFT_716779 [Rhizoclosmatium globosum]|uniref:Uncharacterized protein n=1 Tax=Rhizoclosmatium globosum TaxID=329046 RepID=A0A1Y2CCQ8_9FUNG|nr:hypothetical protein BCR33DRAFT_716779 [Rhizoclosmatium globosum]|eukprot:ORY44828.1 hypothetical protein BCR33DRAFT_716779 [Rhizoclosmatium globosum]
MCSPVPCRQCGKTTWAGCGLHIEAALYGVKEEDRCKCPRVVPGASAAQKPRRKVELEYTE